MEKKRLSLLIMLCFVFILFCNFIQNKFCFRANVALPVKEISKVCGFNFINRSCHSTINLHNLSGLKGQVIIDKIVDHNIFIFSFKIITLILLICLCIFLIRKFKCFYPDFKTSKFLIFTFSLLSVYKFIYLYFNNITTVPFYFILVIISAGSIIYFVIYKILDFCLKDKSLSIIIALIVTVFLYNISLLKTEILALSSLLLVLFSLIFCINRVILIKYLKTFTCILLCIGLCSGSYKLIKSIDFSQKNEIKLSEYKLGKQPSRDIYIIILDMYAGSDTLKYYGYDNSPFINMLKEKGFVVYDNMESSYNKTLATFSSVLNLKYLKDINYNTISEAINNAELFKLAKQSGYQIYYLNSCPLELKINEKFIDYSYNYNFYIFHSVLSLFLDNTIFKKALYIVNRDNPIQNSLDIINKIIYDEHITNKKKKKFVFAHLYMPHEPFLYDEFGQKADNSPDYINKIIINKPKYISFLKYANKKVLSVIDKIMHSEKEKPVIIIMGDHGARTLRYVRKDKDHMDEVSKYHRYNFNTILAYYNPDYNKGYYKKSDCLLNFFINFTNENFGTNIKNLPDEKFYIYMDSPIDKINEIQGEKVY